MKKMFLLGMVLVIGLSAILLVGCAKEEKEDEDEEDVVIGGSGKVIMAIFETDSDNDFVFELEQSKELFNVDEILMEDDSHEGEGSGEEQLFTLTPLTTGKTTLTFVATDTDGKDILYEYEVSVAEEMEITISGSSGKYDGADVEPPELYVEEN